MSNGDPPPQSSAPYIIICSGRIEVALVKTLEQKVVAAGLCAARFAAFMQAVYGEKIEKDILPLSKAQHQLMKMAQSQVLKKHEVEDKIAELFDIMSILENQY